MQRYRAILARYGLVLAIAATALALWSFACTEVAAISCVYEWRVGLCDGIVYLQYPNLRASEFEIRWEHNSYRNRDLAYLRGYAVNVFGFSLNHPPGGELVLALPAWPAIIGGLGLWWKFRRRAGELRVAITKCAACGYDLRESIDRCPECGAAVVIPTLAQQREVLEAAARLSESLARQDSFASVI